MTIWETLDTNENADFANYIFNGKKVTLAETTSIIGHITVAKQMFPDMGINEAVDRVISIAKEELAALRPKPVITAPEAKGAEPIPATGCGGCGGGTVR